MKTLLWIAALMVSFQSEVAVGDYCGDIAARFEERLVRQGYQTRNVQLIAIPHEKTHVVVEVWVDGRWHAFDPTFNLVYGDFLSVSEIRRRLPDVELRVFENATYGLDRYAGWKTYFETAYTEHWWGREVL